MLLNPDACPLCGHKIMGTHTLRSGERNTVYRRLKCLNEKCMAVITQQITVVIININPEYGEGAQALSKKEKRGLR